MRHREIVFDIDFNDYDALRQCCQKEQLCESCFPFFKAAVIVLRHVLTEVFGFNKLLFVNSGRRGIHCWVLDQSVMSANTEFRRAVLNSFSMMDQPERKYLRENEANPSKKILNPVLIPLLEHLVPLFDALVPTIPAQRFRSLIFNFTSGYQLLQYEFASVEASTLTNEEIWERVKNEAGKDEQTALCLVDIVFAVTFPRLDAGVTAQINHLLKIPFSVHPTSMCVSLPFDETDLNSAQDLRSPRVDALVRGFKTKKNDAHYSDEIQKFIAGTTVLNRCLLSQ